MTPELIESIEKKKKVVDYLIKKRVLITREILKKLDNENELEKTYAESLIQNNSTPSHTKIQNTDIQNINSQNTTVQNTNIQTTSQTQQTITVSVVSNHENISRKYTTQDFVGYFNSRFKAIEKILQNRQELQNLTSIARILQKKDKEKVSFIGIIYNKQKTKKENFMLTLEDSTGTIKTIVSKTSRAYEAVKDLVPDEVIGIVGSSGEEVVFASEIIIPDIPLTQELKKAPEEIYAAVVSDIHIGSTYFLEEEFQKFIKWINGEVGTEEQKIISQKTKYIFIVGDMVDGAGIYPKQDSELNIKDINDQYKEFNKYVKQIPSDKKIIICAGNHDACRLSEPQPSLANTHLSEIANFPNVTITTNPSYINIHQSQDFPGFLFLLYHGYSYDFYGDTVESIRTSGRNISDRTELIMKYLLQKRHLAPTHSSTLYIPNSKKDPLVIDIVPDFFLSGHIHKSCIGSHRGTIIISGSCFQAKTSFQEKVGHEPEPCKIPIINLQTRKVTVMNFAKQ